MSNEVFELRPNSRLIDVFDIQDNKYFSGKKYDEAVRNLHKENARVQDCFQEHGLNDYGAMLVILNHQYGYQSWRHIPYGKVDDIIVWICGNEGNFRRMLCDIDSKHHEYLRVNGNHSAPKGDFEPPQFLEKFIENNNQTMETF